MSFFTCRYVDSTIRSYGILQLKKYYSVKMSITIIKTHTNKKNNRRLTGNSCLINYINMLNGYC